MAKKKLSEFDQGVLMALANLILLHDEPGIAADVAHSFGLHRADITDMDDFDKKSLKKMQGERGGLIKFRGIRLKGED